MAAHSPTTPIIPFVPPDQPPTVWANWLRQIAQSLNLAGAWMQAPTDVTLHGGTTFQASGGDEKVLASLYGDDTFSELDLYADATQSSGVFLSCNPGEAFVGAFGGPVLKLNVDDGLTTAAQIDNNSRLELFGDFMRLKPVLFGALPAAGTPGRFACVTDSASATWGTAITGGGGNTVLAFDNGAAWMVR